MRVSVKPGDVGAIYRAQSKRLPLVARAGLRAGAERGMTLLKRRTPTGVMGQMKNAWAIFPWGELGWRLDNSAPHAGIVEGGARPHPVSREGVEAIREWVSKILQLGSHLVGPGKGKEGPAQLVGRRLGSRERLSGVYDAEIDSITWAIVNALKVHGQEPKWIVRAVLDTLRRYAQEEMARALGEYFAKPPEK